MGKKKIRKSYHSKGQRPNVASNILKAVSNTRSAFEKEMNKVEAWLKGKNPWISVPSGKGFIKKKANDVYGNYKTAKANLFKSEKAAA